MTVFNNPILFNYLILVLYGFAVIRWAVAKSRPDVFYWLSAATLTASVTFFLKDPSYPDIIFSSMDILAATSFMALIALLCLSQRFLAFIQDPRIFNYIIMVAYALTCLRWTLESSPGNSLYWMGAFLITYVVTFEFKRG